MQGRVARVALTFAITAGALIFSGCGTTGGRISQHPEMYQSLSPRDQALVSQGQIRPGMTMDAVWLAWGTPDQKIRSEERRVGKECRARRGRTQRNREDDRQQRDQAGKTQKQH